MILYLLAKLSQLRSFSNIAISGGRDMAASSSGGRVLARTQALRSRRSFVHAAALSGEDNTISWKESGPCRAGGLLIAPRVLGVETSMERCGGIRRDNRHCCCFFYPSLLLSGSIDGAVVTGVVPCLPRPPVHASTFFGHRLHRSHCLSMFIDFC